MYMSTKDSLFGAILLEKLLLSLICCLLFEFKHLQCGLLGLVRIQTEQFMPFQIRRGRPPGPGIFSSEL